MKRINKKARNKARAFQHQSQVRSIGNRSHTTSIVSFKAQVNRKMKIVWESQGCHQSAGTPARDGSSPL